MEYIRSEEIKNNSVIITYQKDTLQTAKDIAEWFKVVSKDETLKINDVDLDTQTNDEKYKIDENLIQEIQNPDIKYLDFYGSHNGADFRCMVDFNDYSIRLGTNRENYNELEAIEEKLQLGLEKEETERKPLLKELTKNGPEDRMEMLLEEAENRLNDYFEEHSIHPFEITEGICKDLSNDFEEAQNDNMTEDLIWCSVIEDYIDEYERDMDYER